MSRAESFPDEAAPHGFGGTAMYNGFTCAPGSQHCGSECWGGFEVIAETAQSVTIRTDGLWVGRGQDCGGYDDITEVEGQPVSFKLFRAADAACAQQ